VYPDTLTERLINVLFMLFSTCHDWYLWLSPVIAVSVRSDLVDILGQETCALTGGACMHTCTIGGAFLEKELDPPLEGESVKG
jgi:hypothetical protein